MRGEVFSPQARRRFFWAGGILVCLLLLVLLPPLINANRFQRKIAQSMSDSLGRPVHLDNVSLHLLPVPGLTLDNLVVGENPAFGAEPTIRANTVEATLRLGSLWRRRVEFSTVRFVEPNVNLVRNAQGRWNLADVLLHAAHVDTAPTVQRRAGPAPRFPYIEATGGRVNIKLAEEKLPFSLTDTEFALWLPTANHWRVRLKGQPARTDTFITDPGVMRLEGDLERATTAGAVPIRLRLNWHDAPLGEASHILTGQDRGWRGNLNLDAAIAGTLSAAQLHTRLTLGGLRRAEFAPAQPVDLQVNCGSGLSVTTVTLADLRCTMPDSGPTPMILQAASLDLSRPLQAFATVTGQGIPLHWALLWAALFSSRVPTDLNPHATLDVNLIHAPASEPAVSQAGRSFPAGQSRRRRPVPLNSSAGAFAPAWAQWTGDVRLHLPPVTAIPDSDVAESSAALPRTDLVWNMQNSPVPASVGTTSPLAGISLALQPAQVVVGPNLTLNLSGAITAAGYTLLVDGNASPAALLLPARYVPQLGDGLEPALPDPTSLQPVRVQLLCTRPWAATQTCNSLRFPGSTGMSGTRH